VDDCVIFLFALSPPDEILHADIPTNETANKKPKINFLPCFTIPTPFNNLHRFDAPNKYFPSNEQ
jgi:hypothetical protein